MSPLDWLRAKVASAVRIGPGPLGEPTQADLKRVVLLVVRALEDDQQETVNGAREYATVMPRQLVATTINRRPSWNSDCDCWPQYISCCCDVRKHTTQNR